MPLRTPSINEIIAFSVQTGQGVENTSPVTADIVPFISAELTPAPANVERKDKGLGRSFFGFVKGGDITASWKASLELVLAAAATPVAKPSIENLLVASLGGTSGAAVSFSDTVQASPTPTTTVFAVASASGLQANDPISIDCGGSVGIVMRPILSIATNTITLSLALPNAPATGAKVKARIIRLATAPVYMTITNWLRATDNSTTAYSYKAVDALVNSLLIDFSQAIINLAFEGPAAAMTRSSIAAIPSLPTFSDVAQARNFGSVWWGGSALTAYDLKITLTNSAKPLPVPFGSQFADGTILDLRTVDFDLTIDANDVNASLMTDSENKTQRDLFGYSGSGEGTLFAFHFPAAELQLFAVDKSQPTIQLKSTKSAGVATAANNEFVIAIA
jgi:hypothetical protein